MTTNRHGLSRDVPADIKRLVRKRCGYGCVLCGGLFCQYHHFSPEFNNAVNHDPEGITLLCARHHDEVTRGRISPNRVIKANKNPYSVKNSEAKYLFEDLEYPLEVALGGLVFITPDGVLLKADNEILLSLRQDEDGIVLLSGKFSTPNGELLNIIDNELATTNGHWDIESRAKEIIIRSAPGEVVFHLNFIPPHRLQVVKIKNHYKGHIIDSEFSKKLYVHSASGATIDFASGFIAVGGNVELDKDRGIIISGGSLVMGTEDENSFKGTTMDYLIDQVRRVQEMST
jgi:hypothetical protein